MTIPHTPSLFSNDEQTTETWWNDSLTMTLYDARVMAERFEQSKITQKDVADFLVAYEKKSPVRRLQRGTRAMLTQLARRQQAMPAFAALFSYLANGISLSLLADKPALQWRPLLLAGAPGLGKTWVCQQIAQLLGLDFKVIDCASVSAVFELKGGNSTWSSAQCGQLARLALESAQGNFLLLLDEVDKMTPHSNFPPMSALYPLLEAHTATTYFDHFLEIPFDLSHVNIIATANDPERIDPPILSRFEVLDIALPSGEGLYHTYQMVYQALVRQLGIAHRFRGRLLPEALERLKGSTPREARQQLEAALGRYARYLAEGAPVEPPFELPARCIQRVRQRQRRGIGFTANVDQ